MPTLFSQSNFLRGLDTELDATKTPRDSYSLLINGRNRRDVIEPTHKHLPLSVPDGNYQGLYVAGSFLILFISGVAYYADISQDPIVFFPIAGWTAMDSAAPRIYAEIVPARSNLFNRTGTPDNVARVFNASIGAFSQALFVFDGSVTNRPRVIFPDGTWRELLDFADWTKSRPEYVPYGILPTMAANKLFLVSPDKARILQSVSGRASDFMVNIDNAGEAGGGADTVSITVSFNDIIALRTLSTGQLLASTLYASFAIEFDYENTIFGEPYLNPTFLFPVGGINELSYIDILQDTAFITQSGIHAFNAVAQALRESNNFPIGKQIKGLLLNPQSNTCAINHDDYGFFAVNTIYGYGALVYDTIRGNWTSLDLSFGYVKQFANTRVSGQERLFFITHENKVYEAFASQAINSTRIYLGEWTPQTADAQALVHMVDAVFLNVKTPGQVKFSIYADGKKHDEAVVDVQAAGYTDNIPIPIPFTDATKSFPVGWQFGNKARAWNLGVLVEWNFDGLLSEVSLDGEVQMSENVSLQVPVFSGSEEFAFVGETGSDIELNVGEEFVDGFLCIPVIKGHTYAYIANGNGRLVSGNIIIYPQGTFVANQSTVAIEGPGIPTWSLRDITNFTLVLDRINSSPASVIIGGGNHSYHFGSEIDVRQGLLPIKLPFKPAAGLIDYGAVNGLYFFNLNKIPPYYELAYQYVEFFIYDTQNPYGFDATSLQAAWLRGKLAASTRPFKLVVLAQPPYSTEEDNSPGFVAGRLPFITWGASAVLSGSSGVMERRVVDGLPYLIAATGGAKLSGFASGTNGVSNFRDNVYGYLRIRADALTCNVAFIAAATGEVLDEYAIYT